MNSATQNPTAGAAGSIPTQAAVNADPAAMAAPGYPLDLCQIQGNILGGFNKDFQTFLFLRFVDQKLARDWVGSLAGEVATAQEVAAFDGLFKLVNSRRGGELGVLKATWMNIAFSHKGITFLGAKEADQFPPSFTDGMKVRAEANFDVGPSDPTNWVPALRDGEIHALLIVAADTQEDLGEHVLRYVHNMGVYGVQLVYLQEGAVRQDEPGHEHFGFRDGVSQPGIRHLDSHVGSLTAGEGKAKPIHGNPGQDRLHAGEFVLGYPTQLLEEKKCGDKTVGPNPDEGPLSPKHVAGDEPAPGWGKNGSYLVFRRLAQDVAGFRAMVERLAKEGKLGTSDPEVVGAKLVGRYKSGAPLERTADEEELFKSSAIDTTQGDPSQAVADALGVTPKTQKNEGNLAEDRRLNNHFEYGDDQGAIVPRAAHIRKAYPRDERRAEEPGSANENDSQVHRIMRRGIPFGTSFRPGLGAAGHGGKPGVEEPGDRGLLFLCYQSSIARQFEFIQQFWVHNPNFPIGGDGEDPIIAQTAEGEFVLQDDEGKPKNHAKITHFVTMTGGEYFFQPSLAALTTELGNPPAASTRLPVLGLPDAGDIDAPGADPCAGAE